MPQLHRDYPEARFGEATLQRALALLDDWLEGFIRSKWPGAPPPAQKRRTPLVLSVEDADGSTWKLDGRDDFYERYRQPGVASAYIEDIGADAFRLSYIEQVGTTVFAKHPDDEQLLAMFAIFDEHRPPARTSPPEPGATAGNVFLSHRGGVGGPALEEGLERRGFAVKTFQRSGNRQDATRSLLESLVQGRDFAVVVHQADDEGAHGRGRAREHVLHEVGLSQGRLGLDRAVIVRQEPCEPFAEAHAVVELAFRSDPREVLDELAGLIRSSLPGNDPG
ncbi:MAG: nucleotide-binding protein [Actinomycetota bacterium]|nr:nucleotide-binding protein [Actinomycetota bacterium]